MQLIRNCVFAALAFTSTSVFAQTDAALTAAAKEKGAKVTASGLVINMIKEGTGKQPAPTDSVKVHYKGTFPDGKEFDSSVAGRTWTEVEQVMKVFNAIEEDEEHGTGKQFTQKRKTLQDALTAWGLDNYQVNGVQKAFNLSSDQAYDKDVGRSERLKNLCYLGIRLKQSDYPGTILPTVACAI